MQAHAAVPSHPEIYLALGVVDVAINAHHKGCCQGHGNAAGDHKNAVEVDGVVRVARFHVKIPLIFAMAYHYDGSCASPGVSTFIYQVFLSTKMDGA